MNFDIQLQIFCFCLAFQSMYQKDSSKCVVWMKIFFKFVCEEEAKIGDAIVWKKMELWEQSCHLASPQLEIKSLPFVDLLKICHILDLVKICLVKVCHILIIERCDTRADSVTVSLFALLEKSDRNPNTNLIRLFLWYLIFTKNTVKCCPIRSESNMNIGRYLSSTCIAPRLFSAVPAVLYL